MPLSITHSRAQIGMDAPAVTVEVHLANGLPSLTMAEAALSKRINKFHSSHKADIKGERSQKRRVIFVRHLALRCRPANLSLVNTLISWFLDVECIAFETHAPRNLRKERK